MEIKEYVICDARPEAWEYWSQVLLIEKNKPAWQAGRYNLPGGSIEPGETVHEAAARELFEETGITADDVRLMGTIEGEGFIVYVCRCLYDSWDSKNEIKQKTNERVFWLETADAFREQRLIDNLRIVISFCRAGLMGWTLTENSGIYTISENHAETENAQSLFSYDLG